MGDNFDNSTWYLLRGKQPQIDRAMRVYRRRPEYELCDLQADPEELDNLAGRPSHRETLRKLQQDLEAWMTAQGDRREDMAAFLGKRRRSPQSR